MPCCRARSASAAPRPTFMVIWDKTFGNYKVKGIGAYTAMPLFLLVRDPKIQSIADFTEKDRIALPGVQSSSHAVILEMEAERVFGPGNARKLDPLTVSPAPTPMRPLPSFRERPRSPRISPRRPSRTWSSNARACAKS